MSRSGYTDDWDCDSDQWQQIMYRGAVASSFRGKRGQMFLLEMLAALDAMPIPMLIANDLEDDGAVCAIGAVGKARGVDMAGLDPEDAETVASKFGIATVMAREIVYMNDEYYRSPIARWVYMRAWIQSEIRDFSPVPRPLRGAL